MNHSLVRRVLTLCAMVAFQVPVIASSDELDDIRGQLRDLVQRVDRLEHENQVLRAQNEVLQAPASRQERSPPEVPAEKVEAASWASRVAFSGDLRYRHEQISDDTLNAQGERTADRYRERLRARLSARAQVTEDLSVGIGFATVEGGDPRSSNQTLDDVFSRKSVDLDLAYFDWAFVDGGHLIGGKMKQPFFKPGESLFWDSDVNPEGLALAYKRGVLFGSAYGYWVDEVSAPENARTSDTMLYGGQIGARLPIGESNLVVAAHYYDLSAGQGGAPFYNGNSNGNTTVDVGTPPTAVLLYDYQVLNLMTEFNSRWDAPWGAVPLQFWAEIGQNQDPDDLDTAWAAGFAFGDAADARTWQFGAAFHSVEKDALFAQLIDADLGGGVSDVNGWIVRAGYAPVKNLVLNATWFINHRNVDVPNVVGQTDVGYDRLQLDFNMKF